MRSRFRGITVREAVLFEGQEGWTEFSPFVEYGDEEAAALGIRPGYVRFAVLTAASLATASAVAVSGLIGFVGVIVPHVVRRLAGSGNRVVLPLSLLGGGAFMVLADLVARTVLAPAELPIGVVTMFFGAPFFVVILRMTRASRA